jgi:hypothetical protein
MTDEKICPLCGFDDIAQSTKNETMCDPFGGCEEVPLVYDRCKRCQTSGDFSKINDTLIREALDRLRLKAVKNILQDFSEHKYNFAGLERSLELPQRTLTKWKNSSTPPNAAGVTLLKFLRIFPWLVEVANLKFDFDAAQQIHIEQGVKRMLSEMRFNQSLSRDINSGIEFHFHINQPPIPEPDDDYYIEEPQFNIALMSPP